MFIRDSAAQIQYIVNTLVDYEYKGLYLNRRGLGGLLLGTSATGDKARLTFADLAGYDTWGRVIGMKHQTIVHDSGEADDGDATDFVSYAYGYSPVSNRLYQEDLLTATASELYGYDALHRLTSFKRGTLNANKDAITGTATREQTWTLDHVGNWESIDSDDGAGVPSDARTHNTVNEILTIHPNEENPFSVIHDAAGNLSILPDRSSPETNAQRFTYDYRNRLISIETTTTYDEQEPEWNPLAQYFYDGLNRLAKKHLTSGDDTIYLYDGWRCIEEREWDENGENPDAWEARRQYVYGGIYIDEPLIFDKDTDDDGDCVDAGGSARYFYCQQANYNVVAMADSTGARVETVKYDAYGEFEVVLDGEVATGNPYLFQGQRYDSDAGMYYFRNRWYHPVLGRFMQRDPAGYVDGMGLYEFLGGHLISMNDPLGRAMDLGGEVGAGFGIGFAFFICCDENNCRWFVPCLKFCNGSMVSVGFSAHAVDIPPTRCPEGYAGWFLEANVPYVSGEVGLSEEQGREWNDYFLRGWHQGMNPPWPLEDNKAPIGLGPSVGKIGLGVWVCEYRCTFSRVGSCGSTSKTDQTLTPQDKQDLGEIRISEEEYYKYRAEPLLRSYQEYKGRLQERPRYR